VEQRYQAVLEVLNDGATVCRRRLNTDPLSPVEN
jgi:hypothetical protein